MVFFKGHHKGVLVWPSEYPGGTGLGCLAPQVAHCPSDSLHPSQSVAITCGSTRSPCRCNPGCGRTASRPVITTVDARCFHHARSLRCPLWPRCLVTRSSSIVRGRAAWPWGGTLSMETPPEPLGGSNAMPRRGGIRARRRPPAPPVRSLRRSCACPLFPSLHDVLGSVAVVLPWFVILSMRSFTARPDMAM